MINTLKINILLSILLFQFSSFSQKNEADYENLVKQCSFDSIKKNLIELEKLGIKEVNTLPLKNTSNWLVNNYKNYGYTNISRDTFYYSGDTLFNLIITKKGTIFPDSFLIICGHYDTKNGPGIGDNASGTSIILEIARILKNVNTDISIRFIHFSGEEDGLIGSSHYVKQFVERQNPKIKLVFNIDAVGGVASKTNDKIVCESDQNNHPSGNNAKSLFYTQKLAGLMEKYSSLHSSIGKTYGSDYMPFQNKGYFITGLYEFNESPFAHTSNDLLKNVDIQYIYQVAKGALAAAFYFSQVGIN